VRDTTFKGGLEKHSSSPVLKIPRQCPLVLLVEENLRQGKALGSVKGKGFGCRLCYEHRREDES
jgi:hypothetical protein